MDRQYFTLRFVIVVGLWIMIGVTYRLWLSLGLFPQIPFVEFLTSAPVWGDYVLLLALAFASFAVVFCRSASKQTKFSVISALCLFALVLLNQQRLQPWVYLAFVQFVILASGRATDSMRLMRVVFVLVYVYSAISKFDHSFFQHLGQRFVDTLLSVMGTNPHLMALENKMWLVWMIPVGELVVGIGLAIHVTRRFAVGLAVLLHAMLIVVLGPWGLGHHVGVLIWNVLFVAQVVILFGSRHELGEGNPIVNKRDMMNHIAIAVTVVFGLLPLFEIYGPVDHWPAWSLYSDRTDKVEVFVSSEKAANLPLAVARHLGPQEPFSKWRKLYVEQWSLDELQAPIYPEDRFQIGAALEMVRRYEIGNEIRIVVYDSPNRFTGVRANHVAEGADAVTKSAESFWLNTEARTR